MDGSQKAAGIIQVGDMAIYPTFTGGEEGIRCGKIDTSTTEKDRGSQFAMPCLMPTDGCAICFFYTVNWTWCLPLVLSFPPRN